MSSAPPNIIIPSSKTLAAIPRNLIKSPQTPRQSLTPSQASAYYANLNANASSKSIYTKNLNRRLPDLSLSSFSFLFSESIQYLQKKSNGIQDLEAKYVIILLLLNHSTNINL